MVNTTDNFGNTENIERSTGTLARRVVHRGGRQRSEGRVGGLLVQNNIHRATSAGKSENFMEIPQRCLPTGARPCPDMVPELEAGILLTLRYPSGQFRPNRVNSRGLSHPRGAFDDGERGDDEV